MPGNAALYAPTTQLPSPADVRAIVPDARVFASSESGADKNPRFVIAWPDLKVTLSQMPGDKLASHLEGFAGYVRQRCDVQAPELLSRIEGMKLCLGVLIEPGFDEENRAEAFLLALTGALEGVCFVGGTVFSPEGEPLASPRPVEGGDEEEDEEASEPAEPPSASRVAHRALVLGALSARASLEGDEGGDREERRRWLVGRVAELGLGPELEPEERDVLATPVGELSDKRTIELSWRSEGLAVLAWALGLRELPSHDQLAATWELIQQDLRLLSPKPTPVLVEPRLRAPEELKRMERRLLAVHWRLREYLIRPGTMNLREFARTAWFGPLELEGIPLAEDDLAVEGMPLARAAKQRVWECQSIALERHQAINWLLGQHRRYSRVDTST